MASVPGKDTVLWSDDQTRFVLQLRIEEELKGNMRNKVLNETARQTIADKFYNTYGVRHPWIKFRNKFNSCKKQYRSNTSLGTSLNHLITLESGNYILRPFASKWEFMDVTD